MERKTVIEKLKEFLSTAAIPFSVTEQGKIKATIRAKDVEVDILISTEDDQIVFGAALFPAVTGPSDRLSIFYHYLTDLNKDLPGMNFGIVNNAIVIQSSTFIPKENVDTFTVLFQERIFDFKRFFSELYGPIVDCAASLGLRFSD